MKGEGYLAQEGTDLKRSETASIAKTCGNLVERVKMIPLPSSKFKSHVYNEKIVNFITNNKMVQFPYVLNRVIILSLLKLNSI